MTVQIITDSASDITPELARQTGVTVVPLQVLIEGHSYRDGVDLSPAEFYGKMRAAKHLPKTSQPNPGDMMAAYREALPKGPVLSVHVSSALSGTYQTAVMVAKDVDPAIHVFDTRNGSGGEALMVLEAASMAAAGESIAAIELKLEVMRAEVRTLVALNTLENAVKGGRVNPLAGLAAGLLGVKPIVHVTAAGKVVPIDKVRGRAKALDRLLDMADETRRDWAGHRAIVAHGNCLPEAEEFVRRVKERFSPAEVLLLPIGAAIGTYSAEGALLFSF